jgi:hypothetical protein
VFHEIRGFRRQIRTRCSVLCNQRTALLYVLLILHLKLLFVSTVIQNKPSLPEITFLVRQSAYFFQDIAKDKKRLPFSAAPKVILALLANCLKLVYRRQLIQIFLNLHAVLHLLKGLKYHVLQYRMGELKFKLKTEVKFKILFTIRNP